MARVFVSYSSKSRDQVRALSQDLETAGNQVWFDHKLTGGQAWWDQILEQIRQCELFVFALTPDAMDSHPCKLEYTYAHELNKNILPVLLTEGVSVNLLPPALTSIQFVDYRGDDKQSAFQLMNALNKLPPTQPLPDPLPPPPPVPISYIGNLKDQIDTAGTLSFEEQASLVFKLKEYLRDEDTDADAITLLRQLRKRDDLFARIGEEIDELLENAGAPSRSPRSIPHSPPQQVATSTPPPNPAPAQQQRHTVQVHKPEPKPGDDEAWSTVIMIALAVGTFIIPLIGIVAGVIGMRTPAKRNQGIGLLIFGIIMALVYVCSVVSEMSYYGYYF